MFSVLNLKAVLVFEYICILHTKQKANPIKLLFISVWPSIDFFSPPSPFLFEVSCDSLEIFLRSLSCGYCFKNKTSYNSRKCLHPYIVNHQGHPVPRNVSCFFLQCKKNC